MKKLSDMLNILKFKRSPVKFKFYRQLESLDCGPACLKMIFSYFGKHVTLDYLREACLTNRLGTSIYSIIKGAKAGGLEAAAVDTDFDSLIEHNLLPCILLVNSSHFIILYEAVIRKPTLINRILKRQNYYKIADPGFGLISLTKEDIERKWLSEDKSVAIIFEPAENFDQNYLDAKQPSKSSYVKEILKIVRINRKGLGMIFFGMLLSSLTYLSFPVLTQRLVDVGIKFQSRQFIEILLLFQVILVMSVAIADAFKSLLLLFIGAKIEISLTRDFLDKLMKLPLYFFENKVAGDLMQRISDNNRIQFFIKNYLLDFLISVTTLLTLLVLMANYNFMIFLVFAAGSLLSIAWSLAFIKKREMLDYRKFDINAQNADNLIETITTMTEIRLNNAEGAKAEKWEEIQLLLLDINAQIVKAQQLQISGTNFINQLKNIGITFLSAMLVISGKISLGEMVSVSFMVGQLSLPINQIIQFFQFQQDAKISFTRLTEIQHKEDEDHHIGSIIKWNERSKPGILRDFHSISIDNLSFSYSEDEDDLLFKNLSFEIERGKITAIVGASGSGKTTLLKLLLKFYLPFKGKITIDDENLAGIPSPFWRKNCGVVLQEGLLFSDTVAFNISLSTDKPDLVRLRKAAEIACIDDFILTLPLKYKTRIGSSGIGLSTGQKQRILIARAVYRDPEILFFDEATSSLDSNNEKQIHKNLEKFFENKTVLIIAHRLSTVRNADKILVFDKGEIIESGKHDELISLQGAYFSLIKNQLDL